MLSPAAILQASILIVDDQAANIFLLKQMLRGAGYDNLTATQDPRTVCELHRQHRYDLILLDLQMPGLDGFEVMEGLKAIEPDGLLSVLVITGQPEHKLRALAAGARDFITKPFDPPEVLMRVHNLLEIRLLHRRETSAAEAELRQSEERYRRLLMLSPDANFVHTDGLITLANHAFCLLLRASGPEQLLGRTALDLVHPDDQARVRQQRMNHFTQEPLPPFEVKLLRLDGSVVEVEAVSVGFNFRHHPEVHVIARDITTRRLAETALRESEERFKFVARAVSDAIWDWNIAAGTFWRNDGFLATFGFVAGEIEPGVISWPNRIHPDERSRVVTSIHQAINGTADSWTAEYRFECKDGHYAPVQDRGYILRDAHGRGVRMVGGMRDLTEQKKMEAQYLRAQRMEGIGTLAGGIAHDLNNVFAPIMMSIELLKFDPATDPRRSKILDIIRVSCRRGSDLVRQVLGFARGLDGQHVIVQLRTLIVDLESIISEIFPRDIQIVASAPNNLWPVQGDPTQLSQVLLNLAVNARDAMPAGGQLTVTAANLTLDAQYAGMHPEAKAGPYVSLEVTDTGTGIPPEIRARIFEPFFTTKEIGKGTGIGLATVQTVVKNHGGFIQVDSEPGRGTTFRIFLPADPAHRSTPTVDPFPDETPAGRGELVLVIDDEYSIRDITRQTLEAFGYRVLTARDGAEAIALYAPQSREIALVLTDMMMPVLDGAATIQVLRRMNPDLRIIAVSGIDATDQAARSSSPGTRDFLLKPYTAKTLLTRIREVLDRPLPSVP